MVRIAYLGPEGTFTEAALVRMVAAGLVPETGPDALQRMPVERARSTGCGPRRRCGLCVRADRELDRRFRAAYFG